MRAMHDSHLAGHSQYLHEYEKPQVVELYPKEVLRLHGLLEHIDSILVRKCRYVFWWELIRLAGLESFLSNWVLPEDCIETSMIIIMVY